MTQTRGASRGANSMIRNSARHIVVLALAAVVLPITGCGDGEISGLAEVAGTATWKGKPIPSGFITFSPDAAKGARGTQGLAFIREGKFDTRVGEKCRGVVPGPLQVMVSGYDGVNPSEENPWGAQLFTPYITTLEVPEATDDLVIEVP
jgi:hypothetical protein